MAADDHIDSGPVQLLAFQGDIGRRKYELVDTVNAAVDNPEAASIHLKVYLPRQVSHPAPLFDIYLSIGELVPGPR